jgi:uncharacterized paraquat-inducible protein A
VFTSTLCPTCTAVVTVPALRSARCRGCGTSVRAAGAPPDAAPARPPRLVLLREPAAPAGVPVAA